jgi:hypothetical protein
MSRNRHYKLRQAIRLEYEIQQELALEHLREEQEQAIARLQYQLDALGSEIPNVSEESIENE